MTTGQAPAVGKPAIVDVAIDRHTPAPMVFEQ